MMNNLIKTITITVYILFTQVYSVVHWHSDDHRDGIQLEVSIHPPELPVDDFHNDPGHHTGEDNHDDNHFVGTKDYTFTSTIFPVKIESLSYIIQKNTEQESQVLNRKPRDIPPKLPRENLQEILPNRAPPVS
jgi:hypothetical protein